MLLLDEPTNHLDAESVARLERFLHDFEGTVVAITHDRYFLDNVAGWILELDAAKVFRGKATTPRLEQKDQRLAQEASQEAARRKSIEKELEWVRRARKAVSLRAKPARRALKSLTTLNIRNVTRLTNCSFRRARVWAIKFWKSAICANPTATAF